MEATAPGAPDAGDDLMRRRRLELGAFLRLRRSTLRPQDIGLHPIGRRHVKGLRREEVADAASIGVSWYTMLEQGRIARVTTRTLDAIADVLLLDVRERAHLRNLAAASLDELAPNYEIPPPGLVDFIRTYPLGGAHLHDSLFDLVSWSPWSEALYRFSQHGERPNLLDVMVRSPHLRERMIAPSWSETLEFMVGHFRIGYAAFGDRRHEALADRLSAESTDFRRIWHEQRTVRDPATATHVIDHPVDGRVTTMVVPFRSPSCPTYTVILNNVIGSAPA